MGWMELLLKINKQDGWKFSFCLLCQGIIKCKPQRDPVSSFKNGFNDGGFK